MSMYTDPDHIRVEGIQSGIEAIWFPLFRCIWTPWEDAHGAEMKEHYQRGGVFGDVKTKRYLLEITGKRTLLYSWTARGEEYKKMGRGL